MKLRRIYVNGFGQLAETGIETLEDGLVLLEGPNGAGKSTFLEFVTSLLFGYPVGRGSNKYSECVGGLRGGYALLETDAGQRLRWERGSPPPAAGSLTVLSDGVAIDPSGMLGSANRDLYGSVFALGLNQLQDEEFKADRQSAIEAAITGMGVHGLPKAIDKTTKELKLLGARMASIQNELAEADEKLKDARARTDRYDETVDAAKAAEQKAAELWDQLKPAEQSARRLARLLQAWGPYCDFEDARRRMLTYGDAPLLDPESRARLFALRDRQRRLQPDLEVQRAEVFNATQTLAAIERQPGIVAQASVIEGLSGSLGMVREAEIALPERNRAVEVAESLLKAALTDLGSGWTEDRLDAIDTSVASLARGTELAQGVKAAWAGLQRNLEEIANAQSELEAARKELEEFDSRTDDSDSPLSQEELERKEAALERARELIQSIAGLKSRIESAESSIRLLGEVEAPKGLDLGAIAMGVGIVVIGLIAAFFTKLWWIALFGILAGLAVIVPALRRPAPASDDKRTSAETDLANLRAQLDAGVAELDKVAQREEWDLSQPTNLASIAAELRRSRDQVLSRGFDRTRQLDAERRFKVAESKVVAFEQRKAQLNEELATASEQWLDWKVTKGYPNDLPPDYLERFENAAIAARARQNEVVNARANLQQAASRVADADLRLARLFEALGQSHPEESLADSIVSVSQRLRNAQEAETEYGRQTDRLSEARHRVDVLAGEIAEILGEIETLHASASAKDDEAFLAIFDASVAYRETKVEFERARSSLATISGPNEGLTILLEELAQQPGLLELQEAECAARECADSLAQQTREAEYAHVALRQDVRNLEEGADLGNALNRRAELQAELESTRLRWTEMAVAKILLAEAKNQFQTKVQGGVLEKASYYMGRLTDGQSESIRKDGENYQLLDRDGTCRLVNQLNRSHAERLLLSVRFGYVDHYCDERESLPVVLDDILVNFDPRHQRLAMQTIFDFSARRQVIYLTCHPSTRELFEEAQLPFQHVKLQKWKFESNDLPHRGLVSH